MARPTTLHDISTTGLAHSIVNSLLEGVVVYAPDGSIVWCNDAASEILGLPVDQILGRTSVDPRWLTVHDDGSPWTSDSYPVTVTMATGRAVENVVMGVHRPDDSLVWLHVSSSPLDDATEIPGGAVTTFVNVTERHNLLRQLETARHELQNLFAVSPTGMALMSTELDVLKVNPAFADMVGWSEAELVAGGMNLVIHPDDLAAANDMGAQLLSGQLEAYRTERRLVHRDGQILHVIVAPVIVSAIGDVPWRIFTQVVDVTESRRHEQQLRFLAEHDMLTGLLNRRGFARHLHAHLAGDAPGGGVLIVDLDHFKQVNDRGGHESGDRLLVAITRTIRERLHPSTAIARLGGDEFGLLVRGVDGAVPTSEAQAVVDAVIEICTDFEGHQHDVTASVGVAPLSGPSSASAVLKRADDALYIAKREGRSRWACLDA